MSPLTPRDRNATPPPELARWLLQHFGSSPNNESVLGDLEERYDGHSPRWYWQQVFRAIGAAWFADIVSNRMLAAGVLGISGLHIIFLARAFRYLAGGAANPFTAYIFTRVLPYGWWGRNAIFWPVDWLLTWLPLFLISIAAGWLVARFRRDNPRALVLTCAALTCLVLAVPTLRMLINLPAIPLYFAVQGLVVPFQTVFGILLGGGLLRQCRPVRLERT
jgi:hypothetical protein